MKCQDLVNEVLKHFRCIDISHAWLYKKIWNPMLVCWNAIMKNITLSATVRMRYTKSVYDLRAVYIREIREYKSFVF